MFYYLYLIVLIVISLWIAIVSFIWAVQTGQFSGQNRARYLPLRDDNSVPAPELRKGFPLLKYVLSAILIGGVILCLIPLGMALHNLLR